MHLRTSLSHGLVFLVAVCLLGADKAPVAEKSPGADKAPNEELKRIGDAIKAAIGKVNPAPKFEYPHGDTSLIVTFLPQTYKIHGVAMNGEVSAEAHDEEGPSYQGLIVGFNLQPLGEVNQAVTPQTLHRPYWLTELSVTPLGASDQQMYWSLSYGVRTDKKLLDAIRKAVKDLE